MSGVKRDCRCPIARHVHGTWAAYTNDRCRCAPCRTAWATYTRDRRRRIAHAAWTRWPLYVTPHGTTRRLQALATLGYGANELAPLLGTVSCVVQNWRNQAHEWLYGVNAAKVAELYDRLWDTPSADRYALKTRRLAAARGWKPPLAWDDDTIDDPTFDPRCTLDDIDKTQARSFVDEIAVEQAMQGRPVHLTRAERQEAVTRLTEHGHSAQHIANLLRVAERTVQRRRAA